MIGIRVYLAGHYSRKVEIAAAARELEALGIKVTSTWFRESFAPNVCMKAVSESFCRKTAKRDVRELTAATHFVLFTFEPDVKFTRGGHCVENGIAWGLCKTLAVVGPRQHIFHYLPGLRRFDSWGPACAWLERNNRAAIQNRRYARQ